MGWDVNPGWNKRQNRKVARALAEGAFSRAAGAPLIPGNSVRLLKDGCQNYPAWLDAIRAAKQHVHFESYIIHNDDVGREFGDALIAKAEEGVRVRVIYDWLGAFGKTSWRYWSRLRNAGIEVRCYNPPSLEGPFAWVSRDHRKMIEVDGEVAFVSGLCVGQPWMGNPAKKLEPWRDTGVEVRGNAVVEIARAFAQIWETLGPPIPESELPVETDTQAGNMSVHVVATTPMTARMSRGDELIAALARERLWLTDAYYAGMTSYVQALKAAAEDGVDVRLLVPSGTDIPILRPLSRAGYRPLLEAGVRVFEWNGTMLHAKTALADNHWARVGSSNLNIFSWFGNCELDLVIDDEGFAREMQEMYLQDLENATEIVLDVRNRVRTPGQAAHPRPASKRNVGSAGRAAAGALRIGSAVGAAFTNRRAFEPVEARILALSAAALFGLAVLFWFHPKALVYPVIVLCSWLGAALLHRGYRLHRKGTREKAEVRSRAAKGSAASQ
jgi:cardiolipin synthase